MIGGVNRDGGIKLCETGSGEVVSHNGGLRNSPLFEGGVSVHGARRDNALNALLAMRFSSQRMAAAYHAFGSLFEGRPFVRQAT